MAEIVPNSTQEGGHLLSSSLTVTVSLAKVPQPSLELLLCIAKDGATLLPSLVLKQLGGRCSILELETPYGAEHSWIVMPNYEAVP